jgi:hypothetical protein
MLLRGNRGKKQSTPKSKKKQNKTVLSDESISLHLESSYESVILDEFDRVVPKNNPNIYDYEPESKSESDSENEDEHESERVNKKICVLN